MRVAGRIFCSCLFLFTTSASAIENLPCTYCGSWVPTTALFSAQYKHQVAISVAQSSISFPNCAKLAVERVQLVQPNPDYISPPSSNLESAKAVLRAEHAPLCDTPISGLDRGASIRLDLRPRGDKGWEELVISVYPLAAIEDVIHGGEIQEYLPLQRSDKKQSVKKHPEPTPVAQWWFVRGGHNPCDEGTTRGEFLCVGWHAENPKSK